MTIIFALGLLVTISTAYAQNPKKVELYLNGAVAFPFTPDEFSDYWKTSFLNAGGGIGYVITPAISTIAYFDWCSFGFDANRFLRTFGLFDLVSVTGLRASIIVITANFKASIPSGSVRPYFCGGGGLFLLSVADGEVIADGQVVPFEGDSENAASINFGAGIDFTVAKTADIFVDGRYILGFTEYENTSILPIRFGIKLKL